MMRNRFYVFCLALMAALMVQAQELVRTEYFIDTDPGYGNAASVSTPLLGLNSIELDLDGVQPGAHLLCLRTVDSNGRWSATTMHPILVKGPDNDGTVARIEYFFDSDPGYGQGRSAENPTTGESQYALSVDGLTQGAHMLFIRATDNQGRWSEVTSKSIFVINNGRGEVSRIEYFFDTDPGFGQATAIENPQNGEANYALSIDGLSQGAHTLYLRAADDRGIWSSVIAHPLYVCGPTTGIAALEYFFDDNDPGEGQATQVTLPENPLEQFVFSANASALAEGNHTLNVRAKGTDGIWRLISNRIFAVTTSVPGESEPYAVLSDDNTVLTFYFDDQKETRGGMSVGPFTRLYYDDESQNNKVNGRGWDNTVTSVVFDESFANCTTLTSTAYWFFNCSNLTSINNIEYLKTDNVTDMNNMFCNCRGLTSLNVTNFKTENVTDMGNMFYVCSGLTSLDVTNFKTENVTNMAMMFFGCSGLTSLDVTNFKTDNVTDMSYMFDDCRGLTSLDVTSFKTDNVIDMSHMFSSCSGLTSLDVTNFKTDNVTDMGAMFAGCSGLTSLDVTSFKTDNVTKMNSMFVECSGLTSLDVSNFQTDNVTDMSGMFNNCSGLTSLDLTSFKTDNVTNMNKMFNYCRGLTSLDVSSFKTDKVTEISYMFEGCSGLTSLDVSSFKTDNVTNLFRMFASNPNLKTIYASSDWSTAAVQIGSDMFIGCTNLVGGMGTVYDADHTDHTYAHIDGGESNPGYFTDKNAAGPSEPYAVLTDSSTVLTFYYDDQKESRGGMSVGPFTSYYYDVEAEEYKVDGRGWDKTVTSVVFDESFANCTTLTSTAYWFYGCSNLTSITNIEYLKTDNVTNMSYMFDGCSGLTLLNVTNFKTENVTNMGYMFSNCSGLTSLDVTNFKTDNVTDMSGMFLGCGGLTSLDVTNFKTDNVTNMYAMFAICSGLNSLDVTNFKTDNVTDMGNMFDSCRGLTSLDVTNFKTDNVTNMRYMFSGCSGLTSLDVTNFKTDNVTSMRGMFKLCGGLTSLDLTNFKTDNVTDMSEMFYYCSGLTSLDVSSFKTDKVSEMNWMFANNLNLKTIYASSDWSTAAVENGNDMFAGCTNLVGGMGTVYDENHVDYTYAHIDGGESNPGYLTDKNAPVIADAEPYAVLSDNNTVLTFYYDDQKVARGGMSVGPFNASDYQTWYAERRSITTVVFDESFANCTTLTSTAYWFYECSNLTSITNIEFLKTDNVTNMSEMFSDCSGLTSLDVSNFKTDNVTDMSYMFSGCWNLTRLDVSGFNTEHVTNIGYMFEGCSNLTSLDVSGFKTDNVWGMYGMFAHCSNLKNLDVSRFNTANVTDMRFMFRNCSSLTSIDVSGFNTANVTDMYGMFSGCTKLTSLDVSRFNTANVREMAYMFSLSSGLTSLDLSGFNTSNVTNMREMFEGCSNLTTIYASSDWSTAAVEYGNDMFYACTNLVGGMGTVYDANHIDHAYAHIDGGTANPGYFTDKNAPVIADAEPYAVLTDSSTVLTFYYDDQKVARGGMNVGPFNASDEQSWSNASERITKVVFDDSFASCTTLTSTSYWFDNCKNLQVITGLDKLNTTNVTNMSRMFYGCYSLTSLDLSSFNTANVTNMVCMFYGCYSLTSLDLSSFNTAKVTDMQLMFGYCSALTSLDLSSFNTANVMKMNSMFVVCTALTSLDLSNFNTANVWYMNHMFYGCTNLKTIYASSEWSTESVQNGTNMFEDCTSLVGGMGTVYDANHIDHAYAHIDGGTANPGYFTDKNAPAPVGDMAYAVLSDNNTVLTFYYDDQMQARGGLDIGVMLGYLDEQDPLREQRRQVKKAVFDPSFANYQTLYSTNYLFFDCSSLTEIKGMENLNTSNVTSMQHMFSGCSSIESIDLSHFNTEKVVYMIQMFMGCSSLKELNLSHFNTANVSDMRFLVSGCSSLLHLDISGFRTSGATNTSGLFYGCSSLASIMAGNAVIPDSIYAQIGNPNLLVYVNSEATAPTIINNVVVNGVARNIVLTDALTGYGNFNCPQAFRAEHISYRHNFQQETQPGVSRGWEGIALPFNVQTITHEHHGALHPFGTPEEGYPFWLRQLTPNGIVQAVRMIANRPYIISMPNSQAYHDEYNQSGWVTFAANDVTVPVTTTMVTALADSSIVMIPTMQRVEQATEVYAINRNQPYAGYLEGSIFVSNLREVRPFEAYTEHHSASPAPMFYPIDAWMDGGTGIDEMENELLTIDNAYNLNGQRVKTPRKGVFIVNGRKTVVK